MLINKMIREKKINIVYILPTSKKPAGGPKVIYEHSDIINKLKLKNISSEILHIKKKRIFKILNSLKKNFTYKNRYGWELKDLKADKNFFPSKNWISKDIAIRKDISFNKNQDFIIIPEIMAHLANDLCIKNKIKYNNSGKVIKKKKKKKKVCKKKRLLTPPGGTQGRAGCF